MIIPMVDEATVIPAANRFGYPLFSISGIIIDPIEAVSDADDPEMPPKIILASTFTNPNPPRTFRTNSRLKSINRDVIPDSFMTDPITINRGKAIKAYIFSPEKNRCGKTISSSE